MSYEYALGTYGFTTDTNVTTFPEERRQWRVRIEDVVLDEAKKINQNIDEEADRLDEHLDTIETKVDNVNTYLVQTIKPELDRIETKVNSINNYVTGTLTQYVDQVEGYTDTLEGTLSQTQSAQDTMLQKIYNKVSVLPNNWTWGY
jgi:tetrahydromethanopterin S-methyltransferase subunit G